MSDKRQVGLFCGTFNPIHIGHLLIAECARDQFALDKVIFVTSPAPPHRQDELLDGHARYELVKAAIYDNESFEASDIELERGGPSYTIDTLEYYAHQLGPTGKIDLNLIIGGDNLSQLHTWHRIEDILKLARILVVPRLRYYSVSTDGLKMVGERLAPIQESYPEANLVSVDFPGIAVSGSNIRERIRDGKTILYMVPRPVNDLILTKGYFKQMEHKKAQSCSRTNQ